MKSVGAMFARLFGRKKISKKEKNKIRKVVSLLILLAFVVCGVAPDVFNMVPGGHDLYERLPYGARQSIGAEAFADGCDSNTVTLWHLDGADSGTTFTDSGCGGGAPHTIVRDGNTVTVTGQSKFGGASGSFDGSSDGLHTADSTDWHFGTGDFTIDFWIRFSSLPSQDFYLYAQSDGADHLVIKFDTADFSPGHLICRWNGTFYRSEAWSPSTATWYHLAFVRTGGTIKIFVSGTELGTGVSDSNYNITYTDSLYVGMLNGGTGSLPGNIDEFRVSKGIARWTSNFTPPTAAYSSTSIKKVDGLTYSSVKKVNGLATGSIKKVNGLS